MKFPKHSQTSTAIAAQLTEARRDDVAWRQGRVASLVYWAGEDVYQVAKDAYNAYFSENALGPKAFPSLKKFESEVVAMVGSLFHGEHVSGTMTSGGTESLLLAVKAARDYARATRPHITQPNIVMPRTAHPTFNKAAHYFGLQPVRVPVRADLRADAAAMRAAVDENTVLLVGSAPEYTHGVVDPIAEIAAIAVEQQIPLHVDGCMGGFMLPFVQKLGYPIRDFDFRVPGVTSLSADVHKYGHSAKGASVIVYRDAELGKYQAYSFSDWPNGLYVSPTLLGTRPGGAIASAWAVMNYLGEEGYLRLAAQTMRITRALLDGIAQIEGLEVWGQPDMTLFGFGSRALDIFAIGDLLTERGWYVNRQAQPAGIHWTVTPAHEPVVDAYLRDLREATQEVARKGATAKERGVAYN